MLRFFDKNQNDITDEISKQYCSNPSCLGEPWCSAWGICSEEQLTASGGCDGVMAEQEAAGGNSSIIEQQQQQQQQQEMEFDQTIIEMSQQFIEEEEKAITVSDIE